MSNRVVEVWHWWVHTPWLVERRFALALRRALPYAAGRLIDVGCGAKPYQRLFAERVSAHVGIDVPTPYRQGTGALSRADIFGEALALPLRTGACDTLLCTHVLVHVPEPGHAFDEFHRILRTGGHLILGDRQMWQTYTPHDYYRFTAAGLRYLAGTHGFTVVDVIGIGGFVARLGVKITYALHRLNPRSLRWLTELPVGCLMGLTQTVFYVLDGWWPTPDDVVFNLIVARKSRA